MKFQWLPAVHTSLKMLNVMGPRTQKDAALVHVNITGLHSLSLSYSVCSKSCGHVFSSTQKIHPIPRPWGQDMGCHLWVLYRALILPLSLSWCTQYRVIMDCDILWVHCILKYNLTPGNVIFYVIYWYPFMDSPISSLSGMKILPE